MLPDEAEGQLIPPIAVLPLTGRSPRQTQIGSRGPSDVTYDYNHVPISHLDDTRGAYGCGQTSTATGDAVPRYYLQAVGWDLGLTSTRKHGLR